jgi:hypothetical protein
MFGAGQYAPDSAEGRKLLGHELTHVVQQGGFAAVVHTAPLRVQRYSWDEFVGDVEAVGEAASQGAGAVGEAIAGGAAAVGGAVSGAVPWIDTAGGQLALAAAAELAGLFGGAVRVAGTGIVITIPDMEFCTPTSIPVRTMPMMNALIPIWGWAGVFGPVGVGAAAGFRFGIQPSIAVSYGPCRLRGISLLLDPLAGTYAGTGQLYIAGAVTETAVIEAALKAIGIIGLFDPPIALMVGVEGGLRGTFRGSGVGALEETVRLAYIGGAFSLDLLNTLKLGVVIELDLDFFANASLYDFVVCEYVLPLASWTLASKAERYDLPISVTGGGVSVGPVTSKPIPFSDIEVFINRTRPQTRCLSLSEIRQELCRRGYLPPPLCATVQPDGEKPGVLRKQLAMAICKCVGESKCGGGTISKKCFDVDDNTCKNKGDLQKLADALCNHDTEMVKKCQRDGGCRYRHTDAKCPVKPEECSQSSLDQPNASACATPINVRNGPFHAPIDSGNRVGMEIAITISSSTGKDADMAMIQDSEQVSLSYNHTGSFAGLKPLPSDQSGFMPGYPIPNDRHTAPRSQLIDRADNHGGNGSFDKDQLDIFKDPPCGVPTPQAIPDSGYLIRRSISVGPGTKIMLRTEKRPKGCIVNGFTTTPGPSPTQFDDVVVRP